MTKDYVPGLEKIPAAESSISYIDGEAGILEYRGIRIEELAADSSFDEVAFLLLEGHLPSKAELGGFTREMRAARKLEDREKELIRRFPPDAHPMAALQTCVSAIGMWKRSKGRLDDAARHEWAVEFIGKFPSLIAAIHRARGGLDIVDPDPALGQAADFLRMLHDETPDEQRARALDVALVLHADHTMNASTFATRVVASTESEPSAAIAAAVGTLAGPLHGGANERVLKMLEEIGSADEVAGWLDAKLAAKEKIMGLGHRVYKTKDPRAMILQEIATALFESSGRSPLYDVALEVERVAGERLGERGIRPNVDFYSGIVYNMLGIPTDLFTPIFALSRIAGWMAHWIEQMRTNRLFRPSQIYTGAHGVPFLPISDR